ncbi:hypothetical protein ACP70R_031441 [Stipagrostis hirtigluma subsp. patula]
MPSRRRPRLEALSLLPFCRGCHPLGAAMAPVHDGEGTGSGKARHRRKRRRTGRGTGSHEEAEKMGTESRGSPPAQSQDDDPSAQVYARVVKQVRGMLAVDAEKKRIVNEFIRSRRTGRGTRSHEEVEKRGTESRQSPPAQSQDEDPSAQVYARVVKQVRGMLAVGAEKKKIVNEFVRSRSEERVLTVESEFCDIDDGSTKSLKARRVALMVSQSIVSLSSFAGGKRIRVCSGVVLRLNDNADKPMILTSAMLVRSLNGDNVMISDVMVKVLLPSGAETDGHMFLIDFHYNIAVLEVSSDVKLLDICLAKEIAHEGDVLALGRFYDSGNLLCSQGTIMYQTSIFGCSELLVSNCKITMAGAGGPLVNYNGHLIGINFYEKNQTPYLSIEIVSRILEHHQSFGKAIVPWLGLRYNALEAVPLKTLERIYQKFPETNRGLYISNVAMGSPAHVAGLCVGDILVECGGKVLSNPAEFGAMLLDTCKELTEIHDWENTGASGGNISIEVVIKQQKDGSTTLKHIAADLIKEIHYNRWPAPMPSYKAGWINVTTQ